MKKIGKYEVLEKIGAGGFGEVFKAYDPFIKRHVAVKTCTSQDADTRTRFFQEAEIAGNLQHRNITTVYDFGVEGEVPYLIQEYLSGEDLDRKIKRRDPMPYTEKLLYLVQITRGLAYAHQKGVIHRDVKPANIRILEDGTAKIMDFGIAKLAQQETGLTQTGMTLGTAAYLAPEQIRGEPVGHRTDVFAFGVLTYELLTYERPFQGEQISAVIYQILNQEPAPVREKWPEAPAEILEILGHCLDKDPRQRYADARAVLAPLERLRKGRGDAGVETGPVPVAPTPIASTPAPIPIAPAPSPYAPTPSHGMTPPQIATSPSAPVAQVPVASRQGLGDIELSSTPDDAVRSRTLAVTTVAAKRRSTGLYVVAALVLCAVGLLVGLRLGNPEFFGAVTAPPPSTAPPPADTTPTPSPPDTIPTPPPPVSPPPPPPPPPPAEATLNIPKSDWTSQMSVTVDGRNYSLGRNRQLKLAPGTYDLVFEVAEPDYRVRARRTVTLTADAPRTLRSPLERPGALIIRAKLGKVQAWIVFDGAKQGNKSPLTFAKVQPGEHRLRIENDGGEGFEHQVVIQPGQQTTVSFDLDAGVASESSKPIP